MWWLQTNYQRICKIRAFNRYCVHWKMRAHLHIHRWLASHSLIATHSQPLTCRTISNGTVGGNFAVDRDLEDFNHITVDHNQAHSSFAETITFTGQVNAFKHVDHSLRLLTHQVWLVAGCGVVAEVAKVVVLTGGTHPHGGEALLCCWCEELVGVVR